MKRSLYIGYLGLFLSFTLLTSFTFSQQKVNINFLDEFGEKKYSPLNDKPYTGKVFDLYKSNGNKKVEGKYNNGLKDGKSTISTDEGKFIGQWKNGWKHDRGTYFDSDGGVISECEYKYGRIHGKGTQYEKDGSKIIFEHRKMIFPYDHMSKIWNQTEYCPDGKIIERVKDGEYLQE